MVDWAFGLTEVPYPCTKENTTTSRVKHTASAPLLR